MQIRNQILIPVALVQILTVVAITTTAALLSVRRVEVEVIERLNRIVRTTGESRYPIRASVLLQMKGLSGADFIALGRGGDIIASTADPSIYGHLTGFGRTSRDMNQAGVFHTISINGEPWLTGNAEIPLSPEVRQLVILMPAGQMKAAQREAVIPPLLLGVTAIVVMTSVSYWLSSRMSARIRRMQSHVRQLATTPFDELLSVSGNDELSDLAVSINSMAADLQQTTRLIRSAERTALVAQVAGGLGHQLRNSITGARMAVQLHLRRCKNPDQESLQVALRQLSLTENQIRGLLGLIRDTQRPRREGYVDEIVISTMELMNPQCQHSRIDLNVSIPQVSDREPFRVRDAEQIQAAFQNLLQNAIEAVGHDGRVNVSVTQEARSCVIEVCDSGPGISETLESRLYEPFVTGKPEGIGLGLTLAAQAAEEHWGSLKHLRTDGMTCFRMELRNGDVANRPASEEPEHSSETRADRR